MTDHRKQQQQEALLRQALTMKVPKDIEALVASYLENEKKIPEPLQEVMQQVLMGTRFWDDRVPQKASLAKLLTDKGADLETASRDAELFLAIWDKDKDRVKAAIKNGARVHAQDHQGKTPLADAALIDKESIPRDDKAEILRALLEAGVDPDIADYQRRVPLNAAFSVGDVDAARVLMASGANPHIPDNNGTTPADIGQKQFAELLQTFSSRYPKPAQLHAVAPKDKPVSGAVR